MNTWIGLALATLMVLTVSAGGCAKNQSERRAASPTMKERLTKDTVTGKVNDIGPNYVSIRESGGDSMRVRVNDRTKMDRVAIGDQVKAYVSDDGYASTIQRVAD